MKNELLRMLIQILDDMDLEKQNSQEAWDIVIDFFRVHSLLHTQEAEDMLQVAIGISSLHDLASLEKNALRRSKERKF